MKSAIIIKRKRFNFRKEKRLSDWYKRHKIKRWELLEPAEIYRFDIVGGAWSSNLKDVEKSLI